MDEYLERPLKSFLEEKIPQLHENYDWPIPELPKEAPFNGYIPKGESNLEQNLDLRKFLNQLWKQSNNNDRVAIAVWYVAVWGRIRSNSPAQIEKYALDLEAISQLGIKGIASWSKVLASRNSKRWLIFDARVAASLNVIQLVYGDRLSKRFPRLLSR